jgi:hypothetical protein
MRLYFKFIAFKNLLKFDRSLINRIYFYLEHEILKTKQTLFAPGQNILLTFLFVQVEWQCVAFCDF